MYREGALNHFNFIILDYMKTPTYLVIIPARAGSQRLPEKNMRKLGEYPLLEHSIRYAKFYAFNDIVVTTNDVAVAQLAEKLNTKVIHRPDNLAQNESLIITALQHVIGQHEKKYDFVILLQPTNPLRPKNLMKEALDHIKTDRFDSLMTVSKAPKKLGKIEEDFFVPFNYKMGQRSQDIAPLYTENGLLYIMRSSLIMEGKLLGEKNFPLIVDHPFAEIDIDTLEDFKKAELYLKFYTS